MGMFDYIKCELPLPIGQNWRFQTKDTNSQFLMDHTINAAGRLILHDYELEETPEEELPKKEDDTLWFLGMIRKKEGSDRDVDQNFDGDIVFYPDVVYMDQEKVLFGEEVGLDYRATFRDGQCVEICKSIGKWTDSRKWERVWLVKS